MAEKESHSATNLGRWQRESQSAQIPTWLAGVDKRPASQSTDMRPGTPAYVLRLMGNQLQGEK